MDILELARILYNAVGKASDFRTPLGDPMPRWEVLPTEMQQAWAVGAQAVLDANGTALAVPAASYEDVLPFDAALDTQFDTVGFMMANSHRAREGA